MMFWESTFDFVTTDCARNAPVKAKWGSGLPSLALLRICSQVCPEPVNHFSANAGFTVRLIKCPATSVC